MNLKDIREAIKWNQVHIECTECGAVANSATPFSMHSGCKGKWTDEVHRRIKATGISARPAQGYWAVKNH